MERILLLHGALGASAQLAGLAARLKDKYEVLTYDFTGHGGREIPEDPLSIVSFAGGVLQFLDTMGIARIAVFGYSMGGYVGMYLALHRPERISKVATLGTKYHWDEPTAARETQMLDPEKTEQKVPAFAAAQQKLHAPADWKTLMQKTAAMMTDMGADSPIKPADYPQIATPCLLMLGDRDKMVTLEETLAVYKSLPNARMTMLPGTPHPIERVDSELVSFLLKRFLLE